MQLCEVSVLSRDQAVCPGKAQRVIQLTSTCMRVSTAALPHHRRHQVEQEQLMQHALVPEPCSQGGCEKTSGVILLLPLTAGKAGVDIFCALESFIQSEDLLIFETSEIQGCPSEAHCLKTVEEVNSQSKWKNKIYFDKRIGNHLQGWE